MTLYTIDEIDTRKWRVNKLDDDFNPIATYILSRSHSNLFCSCPAQTWCRHMAMFKIFADKNFIGKRRAFDYDAQKWVPRPKL